MVNPSAVRHLALVVTALLCVFIGVGYVIKTRGVKAPEVSSSAQSGFIPPHTGEPDTNSAAPSSTSLLLDDDSGSSMPPPPLESAGAPPPPLTDSHSLTDENAGSLMPPPPPLDQTSGDNVGRSGSDLFADDSFDDLPTHSSEAPPPPVQNSPASQVSIFPDSSPVASFDDDADSLAFLNQRHDPAPTPPVAPPPRPEVTRPSGDVTPPPPPPPAMNVQQQPPAPPVTANIDSLPSLPAPAAAGTGGDNDVIWYEVRPGDTLSKIATKELGASILADNIFLMNKDVLLSPDHLSVGMKLRIPRYPSPKAATGGAASQAETYADPTTANQANPQQAGLPKNQAELPKGWRRHRIAPGDTLSSISLLYYGASGGWPFLQQANPGINPNRLTINEEIMIPPYEGTK